jgi:multicomponent Na+:H+ antiporter subunit D
MKVSVGALSLGCVAFGVLAGPFVARVAAPAAAGLLDPAGYAAAALGAAATVPVACVGYRHLDANALGLTAIELLLGLGLVAVVLRTDRVSKLLRWPRRVHTGSINDYAAFATVGMIAAACVLLL